MASTFQIRQIDDRLRKTVQPLIDDAWAGPYLAVNGKLWDTRAMPGFAAIDENSAVLGYLLYTFHPDECEIMVLESLRSGMGVGTQLIASVLQAARNAGKQKIVVVTTNDNTHALRFYQRQGFTLRALRTNMLAISRKRKPGIPLTGNDGIPLRDEMELEFTL